ncbi:helix-turn-helix domain-containing protein [Streptomyces acidiscabies]|uniref:helix-turn-helix domain-containing protein n=1 Tax=Streptomyces acidiscabies TaxID=42234 RepID=UPI00095209E9|nr:helix-turn-helix transcriptional regulator [Streptomyces acidiscabies]
MSADTPRKNLNPLESFGLDVRQVRTARRITQRGLGGATGYSESYVSKVESGTIVAAEKFAQGCDRTFGTGMLFVRQLQRVLDGGAPSWFAPYLQLERRASRIFDYSTTFIMGMLQTEEYARATFRADSPRRSAATIEGKVTTRIQRHDVMEREAPPLLWVVLHEACLWTQIGGAEVMTRQLERLLLEAQSPHVTLQVLPFAAGAPATGSAFTMLAFNDSPTVLHAEGQPGGRLYEDAATVANALETYDRLRADAMSPDASVAHIQHMFEERTR